MLQPTQRWVTPLAAIGLLSSVIAYAGSAPVVDRSVSAREARASFARPSAPPAAAAPESDAVAELGRVLFFDPRLSGSNLVACATCHHPGLSFGDGLPRAVGNEMRTLERRTPTLLNVGYASTFFWDGRASSLEEQALGPITAPAHVDPGAAPLRGEAWIAEDPR